MSDTKHTLLPWTWQVEDPDFELYLRTPCAILIGPDGKPENLLAMVKEIDNGAFIVRACNNFDALPEACKAAYGLLQLIKGDRYVGNFLPELDRMLQGDRPDELNGAIAAAEREEASDAKQD